jgi:hypothetical protein
MPICKSYLLLYLSIYWRGENGEEERKKGRGRRDGRTRGFSRRGGAGAEVGIVVGE